jgi:hypothetical protein
MLRAKQQGCTAQTLEMRSFYLSIFLLLPFNKHARHELWDVDKVS